MKISLNGHITNTPDAWNELSRRQLLSITDLMQFNMPETEFKVKVLFLLTGWKMKKHGEYYKIKAKKNEYILAAWQIVEMCKKLDWLFKETETKNGKIINVNATLTRCTIPHFSHHLRKYYGPADRLYNITFGEYIAADNYFSGYVETGNSGFLDKLVATLYRCKDPKYTPNSYEARGDIREPFNPNTIDARAKRISGIPQNIKMAIMLFFNGCKIHLSDTFTEVFTSKPGRKNKFGGLSLVAALTNGDVTKSKTVRKQYLYDVMINLDETARSHRQHLEKMKQKK